MEQPWERGEKIKFASEVPEVRRLLSRPGRPFSDASA